MAKRSGLGRGLESLLGETAGEVTSESGDVKEISLEDISVNPDQPRKDFDQTALEELTDSIRRHGVLQPILLRPHGMGYQVVAGERRFQAAIKADLKTIPAVIRTIDDDKVMQLALIENLQRSDLNPMEEAHGYQTVMTQSGVTQTQLAEILSKSRPAIANALRLLALPEKVQQMVADGRISSGHARAILSVQDDAQRIALARKVVASQLTVRQTENLASTFSVKRRQREPIAKSQPRAYQDAASVLGDTLGTKVRIKNIGSKGRIEIEFSDEGQLRELVHRMRDGYNGSPIENGDM